MLGDLRLRVGIMAIELFAVIGGMDAL